MLLQWCDVDG